mmetsp:Transcript_32062/g.67227  ORF Transcript_32062/g.67227 Transcript_32062/m.67227 type:complete len:93 (-) Transcript_32062:45-323(-)
MREHIDSEQQRFDEWLEEIFSQYRRGEMQRLRDQMATRMEDLRRENYFLRQFCEFQSGEGVANRRARWAPSRAFRAALVYPEPNSTENDEIP